MHIVDYVSYCSLSADPAGLQCNPAQITALRNQRWVSWGSCEMLNLGRGFWSRRHFWRVSESQPWDALSAQSRLSS